MSAARRSWAALALQSAALAVIALSLFGASWLDPRSKPRWLVLVDRSDSMPRRDADQAATKVLEAARAAGIGEPRLIEFAGKAAGSPAPAVGDRAGLDPWATNIEAALHAALQTHATTPLDGVVVVSDGLENAGDALQALRAVRHARLPLQWIAVGRPAPPVRLTEVRAPRDVAAGQRIQVHMQLVGPFDRPVRVSASLRPVIGTPTMIVAEADALGRATAEFGAEHVGAQRVDVMLEDPVSGQVLDTWTDAAVINVLPRAAMLYGQGSAGYLARSLMRGGWALDVVPAARLDAQTDALQAYQAVVLDDVSVADASPRFWGALVKAVTTRGLGLVVLGGERSFARGGYRESTLESVLPLRSEPLALGQPAAVVFAVDKSGSMGEGSGGVDRFRLAQRAVLEAARSLGPGDALGLLAFDVVPRILVPLGPAATAMPALERDWPVSPHGGTRLAPALEAAIGELERSGHTRRLLVLVTDGFVDDAAVAELRARLDRSRIETIALAVGPDADVGALQRLIGGDTGLVLHVDQAADLPLAMRSSLERRRARIERGTIPVEQRDALPFPPGQLTDWPAVASYAVTRPRPEATVSVRSGRGDPLIAFQMAGRGRVVAVASGFGPWTAQWLSWREWPRLAGGLADWSLGSRHSTAGAMTITDLPGSLQVETDAAVRNGPSGLTPVSLVVDTPTTAGLVLSMDPVAPGRWRAVLPDAGPGLYNFVSSDAQGGRQQLHLRRLRSENHTWGTNPALQAWQADGLVSTWDPGLLRQPRAGTQATRPADRSLIALGLLLFLAGILVDRARRPGPGVAQVLLRWYGRAARHAR